MKRKRYNSTELLSIIQTEVRIWNILYDKNGLNFKRLHAPISGTNAREN